MTKKKVVVALGHRALGTTLPEQMAAVKKAAQSIADLIEAGCQVVISHSNGPQVGMIHTAMNEFAAAHDVFTAAPMSVCSAMSQGYIGYDLQNAIHEELLNRGIFKTAATIITQVLVDPYDDAFYNPTKTIGRYLTAEEAEAEQKKGNFVVEEKDKGFRRIIAAPKPIDIVEIDAIRSLLKDGHVVIACGGGGIPVLKQGTHLKGASAVIEKDLVSGKLAELVDADELIILTSVDKVAINYGKDNEQLLDTISVAKAMEYIAQDQFDKVTVLPKIEAASHFVSKRKGRRAIIASLDKAKEAFHGKTGTIIE